MTREKAMDKRMKKINSGKIKFTGRKPKYVQFKVYIEEPHKKKIEELIEVSGFENASSYFRNLITWEYDDYERKIKTNNYGK